MLVKGNQMALSKQDLEKIELATVKFLVTMVYADRLWEPVNPIGTVDAYAASVRDSMLAAEGKGGLPQEVSIAMTESLDVFFESVKTVMLQRVERERKK
jgi:hypothetical protein